MASARILRPMHRTTALVASLALVACTSAEEQYRQDLEAIVTPSTAALRTKETQLGAALAAASTHPPITPIALPAGAPPIDGRDMLSSALSANPGFNTISLLEGAVLDAVDGQDTALARAGFGPQYLSGEAFALLDGWRPPFDEFQTAYTLEHTRMRVQQATSARYVVICRTVAYTPLPAPAEEYRPSSYDGECRVYDLPSTTYLGGVTLHAATRAIETVWIGGTAGSAYSQLGERMRDELVRQLDAALQPLGSPEHAVWMVWH